MSCGSLPRVPSSNDSAYQSIDYGDDITKATEPSISGAGYPYFDNYADSREWQEPTASAQIGSAFGRLFNWGLKGTDSNVSRGRISSQAHELSNDGLSTYPNPTETSTPDSNFLWLPEYSEDEEEKLAKSHPFMRFKPSAVVIIYKAFLAWKESPSDQDEPCGGADEANDAPSQDKGKGKDISTRKRTSADRSETGKGASEGSEPSSSQTSPSKRRRTSDRKLTFACPYTKKNPMSYRDCYKYTLSRIRDVKQHLARRHQKPLYCARCMDTFESEGGRDEHIREASCPLRPLITLDGITESQKQQLAKKSASNTSEEAQWFAVYDVLFPGHSPPESPYIDRELLQDITLYHNFLTANGPRILSEVLTRRGAVTWNLPNEERDLAAFQQTVFEEGLHTIFNQWVVRRTSSTEHVNSPTFVGTANNLTPPSSDTSAERAGSSSNQAPRVSFTIPGREPTNTFADFDAIQGPSSNRDLFTEGLEGILYFGPGGFDLHQEFRSGGPDEDGGPDEELMNLMLDPQARSSFPPAPG
ncbi:hypothetical protein diail_667 [Diaporthe ilicicola]|nr:hypothetical protein diail_667 [Diaporthe ilicicola]